MRDLSQRLVELVDLPPTVGNSLYQGLCYDFRELTLAYHVAESLAGIDLHILNTETAEFRCASVKFLRECASKVDRWDGDAALGHALSGYGLQMNKFYEVEGSQWLNDLQASHAQVDLGVRHRHFVFAFRLRVFQVVAESYVVSVRRMSLVDALRPERSDKSGL